MTPTPSKAIGSRDQRTDSRHQVRVDVTVASDSHFFAGLSGDVSRGGIFVATYADIAVGQQVHVQFTLADGKELSAEGTVRWRRERGDSVTPGVGIRFENVEHEALELIENFCSSRPPIYVDEDEAELPEKKRTDQATAGQSIGAYTIVQALGPEPARAFVARGPASGKSPLPLLIEMVGPSSTLKETADALVERARRAAQVRHPNVARIRDVVVTKDGAAIVSDFVDGATLGDLVDFDAAASVKRFGLPEHLSVLTEALSGLGAVHRALVASRDEKAHVGIHPRKIFVGVDGSARLTCTAIAPPEGARSGRVAARYAAPEVLSGRSASGARADVFAMGVMLWEAVMGRPLLSASEEDVRALLLAGPLPRVDAPRGAEWAGALADLVARALEADPQKRYPTAVAMAGALRVAVQSHIASLSSVAAAVHELAKERIAERRAKFHIEPAPVINVSSKSSPSSVQRRPVSSPPRPSTTKGAGVLRLPKLTAVEHDDEDETHKLEVETLSEDELHTGESEIISGASALGTKRSAPPPVPARSVAPRPAASTPAPLLSSEDGATATIAPFENEPAPNDLARRRRMTFVFGVVGVAAMLFVTAIVKRAISTPHESVTINTIVATASVAAESPATPEPTPPAATTSTQAAASTFEPSTPPAIATPAHTPPPATRRASTPATPAVHRPPTTTTSGPAQKKKTPSSKFEPEAI